MGTRGRGYPSLDLLKEISKFFSVSIDDLICNMLEIFTHLQFILILKNTQEIIIPP